MLQEAETLLANLTNDFPLHAMDEEEDLFRLLKLRSDRTTSSTPS